MKRILEVFRIVIISPELVLLLAVICAASNWPMPFECLGKKFVSKEKLWEYIPIIPMALFVYTVGLCRQLQYPVAGANRDLNDWDQYWALKYRIIAAMLWSFLSATFALAIWFFSSEIPLPVIGCIFIASLVLSLVVSFTCILAFFALREILEK